MEEIPDTTRGRQFRKLGSCAQHARLKGATGGGQFPTTEFFKTKPSFSDASQFRSSLGLRLIGGKPSEPRKPVKLACSLPTSDSRRIYFKIFLKKPYTSRKFFRLIMAPLQISARSQSSETLRRTWVPEKVRSLYNGRWRLCAVRQRQRSSRLSYDSQPTLSTTYGQKCACQALKFIWISFSLW